MWPKKIVTILLLLIFSLAGCKGKAKTDLYSEGLEYLNNGNTQGAIVLFKSALEKDPNYFEARLSLAQSYMAIDRFEVAEKEFQKVLLQAPDNLDALIAINEIQLRLNRSSQSLEQLQAALKKNPDEPRLLTLLGQAFAKEKQFDQAEEIFERVLTIDAKNEQARINLARLQMSKNNYPAAKNLLNQNLEINNKSTASRNLLALLFALEGDREGALAQYLEVFRLDPKNGGAIFTAGLLTLDLNDLKQAEAILETLHAKFPNHPATFRFEGLVLFRQGNFEKATVALQKSLSSQNDLLSFYILGLSQYQLGNYEQAISQFQKGLDLEAGHEALRVSLAQALLKTGRIDDCIAELKKALHYNANSARAHSVLGSAYIEKGDFENAMAMLDRAAELDPQIADTHLKKGIFNLQMGDVRAGEAELEKAVNISPEVLNSRLILATHYLQHQNHSAAIQLLNEGLKGKAEDALLYNYLAAAYFAQKNNLKAIESLKKSIQLAPDYPTPYINLAGYFLNQGEYAQAISVYQDALLHQPKNVRILLSLASAMELHGDPVRALELLQQAAATGDVSGVLSLARYHLLKKDLPGALKAIEGSSVDGNLTPALLEMKVALQLALGKEKDAFDTLLQWTRIDPESGASAMASYYLKKGDQKAALALADKLIVEKPRSGIGYWLKANIQIQLGRLKEARLAVAEGLRRDSQSVQLRLQQADIYQREENLSQSELVLNQLISDQPNCYPALFALGAQKDKSGEKAQAKLLYEKALKINNQFIPVLNNLAYLLAENFGDLNNALDLAIKAYRQMPSSPEVMDTLGYILVKKGRFKEAIPLLEKAHGAIPDHPSVQLHLGMAYQGAGKPEKAKELLEKVLVAGSSDEVLEARRILRVSN